MKFSIIIRKALKNPENDNCLMCEEVEKRLGEFNCDGCPVNGDIIESLTGEYDYCGNFKCYIELKINEIIQMLQEIALCCEKCGD